MLCVWYLFKCFFVLYFFFFFFGSFCFCSVVFCSVLFILISILLVIVSGQINALQYWFRFHLMFVCLMAYLFLTSSFYPIQFQFTFSISSFSILFIVASLIDMRWHSQYSVDGELNINSTQKKLYGKPPDWVCLSGFM